MHIGSRALGAVTVIREERWSSGTQPPARLTMPRSQARLRNNSPLTPGPCKSRKKRHCHSDLGGLMTNEGPASDACQGVGGGTPGAVRLDFPARSTRWGLGVKTKLMFRE